MPNANYLPVAVPLTTHGPGRPAIYYGNFNPATHEAGQTGSMLDAANGSLFIQYGNLDEDCLQTCVTAVWQKSCESDCDTADWIQIGGLGFDSIYTEGYIIGSGTLLAPVTFDETLIFPQIFMRRTSKIGLRTIFTVDTNDILIANRPFTYLWSSSPATTITNGTTATATFVAASPGTFIITCTVTDSLGATYVTTQTVKLDRIIQIGGADQEVSDYFATIAAAISWRNTNAAGQHFRFHVMSDTAEPGVITDLDNADVSWFDRSISTFASSSGFLWAGITPVKVSLRAVSQRPLRFPCIITSGTYGIRLDTVVGTNMDFTNLSIQCLTTGATAAAVSVSMSTNVRFTRCSWSNQQSGVGPDHIGEFITSGNVVLDSCQAAGSGTGFQVGNCSGSMIDCYGELTTTVLTNVAAALSITTLNIAITTTTFDITGGRYISNVTGTSGPGLIRCAIHISAAVGNLVDGLTMMGVLAHNRAAGSSMASVPANAAVGAVRMVGCSGIGAFTNITPIAGTAVAQNHTIPS